MKLLLSSGGVTNSTIGRALEAMLPRPASQCAALCIPTAQWGHPSCGPQSARRFLTGEVTGEVTGDVTGTGPPTGWRWGSVGVLELTALPSIAPERWVPWVRDADVLLVDGGDATFLCHWLRVSGLAPLLTTLAETVWVGISAGSMVLTPRIGDQFVEWASAPDDRTLGLVDFSIFPHLDYPGWPDNTSARARAWADEIDVPAYAIDDQTAITVVDGAVEVVSEGRWERFTKAEDD